MVCLLTQPAITRIRPEELYDCPDSEDLSIHYKDIVLSYVGPDVVQVDGTIEILEPMERPVSVSNSPRNTVKCLHSLSRYLIVCVYFIRCISHNIVMLV